MENQHVLPKGQDWIVKKEGATRASKKFALKTQAVRYAQKLAKTQKVHVFIHQTDGTIAEVKSHEQKLIPKEMSRVETQERIHVMPNDDGWTVKTEGAEKAIKNFKSKYKSIRFAHQAAERRKIAMVVHDKNNRITHIDIPPHYTSPLSAVLHL